VLSCGRCYHNAKRSLVIVSTLVLHLKAAESFLGTSQCTLRTQQRGNAKNPDYEMQKEKILSGIVEDPD